MISSHSSGLVDGLVVLEIGRKDVAQEAQLNDVAVLDHADGWTERRRAGSLSHSQSELIS